MPSNPPSLCRVALLAAGLATSLAAQCGFVSSPGGSGCGSSTPFGIPTIACAGQPQLGNQSFAVTARVPCAMSASALLLGNCLVTPHLIRGPFGANGFCGPTEAVCALYVDVALSVVIPGTAISGGASFAIPVPNDPGLRSLRFCAQEWNLCTLPTGSCLGASQAISITLL